MRDASEIRGVGASEKRLASVRPTAKSVLATPGARAAKAVVSNPFVHSFATAAVALLLGITFIPNSYLIFVLTILFIYAIAAYGLNASAGLLGHLNLGQGAVFTVGAYTTAILTSYHHVALLFSIPAAIVPGAVLGLIMAAPSSRFGHIGLAMMTLGYTLLVQDLILNVPGLTGGGNGINGIAGHLLPGSSAVASQTTLYVVVVGCLVLVYLGYWYLRISHLGRSCLSVRGDDIGAKAIGIAPHSLRLFGFAVGGGVGALAGGLYALVSQTISPGATGTQLSILFLLMVAVGGAGTRLGPVIGVAIVGTPQFALSAYPGLDIYVYGGLLIATALLLPNGIISRTAAPIWRPSSAKRRSSHAIGFEIADPPESRDAIRTKELTRTFGGVAALHDLSITLRRGEILGIIGPNGSGKTTLANVLCGFYPPTSGQVFLNGNPIGGQSATKIARLGLARTFQVPRLFPQLSVAEHFELARRQAISGDPSAALESAHRFFIDETGLGEDRERREVRYLTHGQRRFLEIAMSVTRQPSTLILDEPAAGLAPGEIDALISLLRTLQAQDVSILVIEHHLAMVRELCNRVVVMELGQALWAGSPHDLEETEEVRQAYLGTVL